MKRKLIAAAIAIALVARAGVVALLLAGFAALIVYVLVVLVSPVHKCPRCHGTRILRKGRSSHRCPRCNAHGRTYRLGATLISGFFVERIGPWLRDRIRPVRDDDRSAP